MFAKKGNSEKAWLVAVALLCIAFASCSKQTAENVNSAPDQTTFESEVVPMRIVTDDLGRRITVPTNVRRAVSLAPSVTESIFAVGAGDRLVGVTTFCNYPEEAKAIQKVGDTLNPNIETIVALKPDVVFVSSASQLESFTQTLEKNGIAVYVSDPFSISDLCERTLKEYGIIFNTSETADDVSYKLLLRYRAICRITNGCLGRDKDGPSPDAVKTFVQFSKEPLFTVGKDSFINQLVRDAGGLSVTQDIETAFPKISKETALALQPEAIILSDSPDNQEPNEVFKNSPAARNGRVYKINADIISRPGPRLIDAMEQIARDLHPEKFPN